MKKKEAALAALLECGTYSEAAKKAGVSRRTLYEYINNDRVFAKALRDALEARAVESAERAEESADKARGVLLEIMSDKKSGAAARIKAAALLLENSDKAAQLVAAIADRCYERTDPLSFELIGKAGECSFDYEKVKEALLE